MSLIKLLRDDSFAAEIKRMNTVIYHKIYMKEQMLRKDKSSLNRKKIEALENIKYLLSKVDNTAEVIPSTNYKKLSILLSLLKGERLTKYEKLMLKEIIEI